MFLNRSPQAALGVTERFSGTHEQRPLLNSSAVILQNPIAEQGATSVESFWKGDTNHERLRTTDITTLSMSRGKFADFGHNR